MFGAVPGRWVISWVSSDEKRVGALANEVELGGGPGARSELGPTRALFKARVRMDAQ